MSNELILIIFQIAIVVMSVVIHEVAHGFMALQLGDKTAKYAGRLTLNPFNHLDIWGSFIVPLIMIFTVGFPFGWAKPVPYNPYNLHDQKKGPALVGLAGPLSNILLAVVFGLAARFISIGTPAKSDIVQSFFSANYEGLAVAISGSLGSIFFLLFIMIVSINLFLAFFNLIPIPPLDGSKLLFAVLPIRTETMIMLEQFGFMFLLMAMLFFRGIIGAFLFGVLDLFLRYVVGL